MVLYSCGADNFRILSVCGTFTLHTVNNCPNIYLLFLPCLYRMAWRIGEIALLGQMVIKGQKVFEASFLELICTDSSINRSVLTIHGLFH